MLSMYIAVMMSSQRYPLMSYSTVCRHDAVGNLPTAHASMSQNKVGTWASSVTLWTASVSILDGKHAPF